MARRRRARTIKKSAGGSFFGRIFKFCFLFGLIFSVYFYAKAQMHWYKPQSEDATKVSVEIPLGTSVSGIATLLQDKKVIKDAKMFEWYARWQSLSPKLQAGSYIIEKNKTYAQIAQVLSHGKSEEIKITIPEGYTLAQIDELLSEKQLIAPNALLSLPNAQEGFIYPDTYFVMGASFDPNAFYERAKTTLNQKVKPYLSAIESSGRTLEEIITMASLIEREAATDGEMNMISGILWKRIDIGEPLGVDATTRYEKNDWKNPLYAADFAEKTPYNTRKTAGLPPTAIGSPGLSAIKAAVYPKASEYLFYLHDPSGKIHYAATNAQHEQNKSKYLK